MAVELKGPGNILKVDAFQVLRSVFDVDKNCLRVCVVDGSPGSGGGIEVIIDHTNDSIRLGNGTSFFTSTNENGDIALDVHISNSSLSVTSNPITTPLITRVPVPLANTEYSFTIAAVTKKVKFRAGRRGKLQYAFSSGDSFTGYYTVDKGDQEIFNSLDLIGSITVYFNSDTAGETLEILEWN